MRWHKFLLIPRLIVASVAAPRSQQRAWERYWSRVRRTGPHGEVLWDAGERAERDLVAALLRQHADGTLPIVDLGCGSGRQAWELTAPAPRVVGVDGSAAAIAHARRSGESRPARPGDPAAAADWAPIQFRVADITEPDLGVRLHAELGDANVHIRGVLHVLTDQQRRTVADTIAALLGDRGTLFLFETDHAGDSLDYLVAQGATPFHLPAVVDRLVRSGVRAPRHFGAEELTTFFPPGRWRILEQEPTVIYGVPIEPGGPPQHIPGLSAVLRRANNATGT
jgi:SAM-dependent methyltransferase